MLDTILSERNVIIHVEYISDFQIEGEFLPNIRENGYLFSLIPGIDEQLLR